MIGATLFSGIGAPETAMPHWHWPWHAEIERFPNAVMAHRHPGSTNLGDVTADDFSERALAVARPDVLVFGSPCQSFSVAGRRLGLHDPRGNLALCALRIVARLEPTWFVFENVPGLLSSANGSDFGLFLRAVDELGYSASWAMLDAQYFGLAQRRERLFLVGHSGDWRYPAAVLLEPESLCGDTPPRRQAGQGTAPTLAARTKGGGGLGTDFDCDGRLISAFNNTGQGWWDDAETAQAVRKGDDAGGGGARESTLIAAPLNAGMGRRRGSGAHGDPLAFGGGNTHGALEVATACRAKGGWHGDFESETFVTHPLRADGFDASEDGTGRATNGHTHAVAFSCKDQSHASTEESDTCSILRALRQAVGEEAFAEWGSGILNSLQSPEILQSWLHGESVRQSADQGKSKLDDGALAREESLSAGSMRKLWRNGPDGRSSQGRQLAQQLATEFGAALPILPPERTPTAVRRLTPREAERLQGYPDDYTAIEYRGKPAADGPRYKALGNSMAVPVMRWILARIEHLRPPPI